MDYYLITEIDKKTDSVFVKISSESESDVTLDDYSLTCVPLTFDNFNAQVYCDTVDGHLESENHHSLIGLGEIFMNTVENTLDQKSAKKVMWNFFQRYGLDWGNII